MLTIDQYNNLERTNINMFSPNLIGEFVPQTFVNYNFKTQIDNFDSLPFYIESQHHCRFEKNLKILNNGLTFEEFELYKKLTLNTVNYCRSFKNHNEIISGRNTILRSLLTYRTIKLLNSHNKKISILEIGPGTGYLGLISRIFNFEYTSFDVTQALYLLQNNFFNYIFPGELSEYLDIKNQSILKNNFIHIPWWIWVNPEIKLKKFDYIVMNHCINEISNKGFLFIIKKISETLKKDGCIVVDGWGGGEFNQNLVCLEEKFKLIHSNCNNYYEKKYLPVSVFVNYENDRLTPKEGFYKKIINYIYKEFAIHSDRKKIKKIKNGFFTSFSDNFLKLPKLEVNYEEINNFNEKLQCNQKTLDEKFYEYINFKRKRFKDFFKY